MFQAANSTTANLLNSSGALLASQGIKPYTGTPSGSGGGGVVRPQPLVNPFSQERFAPVVAQLAHNGHLAPMGSGGACAWAWGDVALATLGVIGAAFGLEIPVIGEILMAAAVLAFTSACAHLSEACAQ